MKEFLPLDYSQIIPAIAPTFSQTSTAEFTDFDVLDNDLGKMAMSCLSLPYMQVVKFDGEVRQNVHLKKESEEETTVDTCVFLDGSVESEFMGSMDGSR